MKILIEKLWVKEFETVWNGKPKKSKKVTIGSGGKYYGCFWKNLCASWKEGDTIDYPIESYTYKDKQGQDAIGYNIILPTEMDILVEILAVLKQISAKLGASTTTATSASIPTDDTPPMADDNDVPF